MANCYPPFNYAATSRSEFHEVKTLVMIALFEFPKFLQVERISEVVKRSDEDVTCRFQFWVVTCILFLVVEKTDDGEKASECRLIAATGCKGKR